MGRKTKEEAEKTYNMLLESAAELFSNQGYSRTTLNEIAEHAGVTRGAFYWHFSGKSDLVCAIFEQHALPVIAAFKDGMMAISDDNPEPQFRNAILMLIDAFAKDTRLSRAMFIIMHNMEVSEKDAELIAFRDMQHEELYNVILAAFDKLKQAGRLKDHIEPNQIGYGCIFLLTGMFDKAMLPFTQFDLERDGKAVFNQYLDAVLTD